MPGLNCYLSFDVTLTPRQVGSIGSIESFEKLTFHTVNYFKVFVFIRKVLITRYECDIYKECPDVFVRM